VAEREHDAKLEAKAESAASAPPPACVSSLSSSRFGQGQDHRPGGTPAGSAEEPPPFGVSWRTLYAIVAGALLLWIALFAAFTRVFR
jgi:hypothetical protein